MRLKSAEILSKTKEFYNNNAKSFSQTRTFNWLEVSRLCQEIKSGSRILDVGCGNGRLLDALTGKKIEYIGIDNSKGLLQEAKIKYPQATFIYGDILELDKIEKLVNKKFDRIFCLAVLHHLPTRQLHIKAVEQMKKFLKPKGKLIISVWNLWQPRYLKSLVFRFWSSVKPVPWKAGGKDDIRWIYAFTLGDLRRLVRIGKVYKKEGNIWAIKNK